jgi:hypothetical protein
MTLERSCADERPAKIHVYRRKSIFYCISTDRGTACVGVRVGGHFLGTVDVHHLRIFVGLNSRENSQRLYRAARDLARRCRVSSLRLKNLDPQPCSPVRLFGGVVGYQGAALIGSVRRELLGILRSPDARRKKSQLQRTFTRAFGFEVASTCFEQIIQRNEAQEFLRTAFQHRHPREAFLCHSIHNHSQGFVGIRFHGIKSDEITEGAPQYGVTLDLDSFAHISARQHPHKAALVVDHWQ